MPDKTIKGLGCLDVFFQMCKPAVKAAMQKAFLNLSPILKKFAPLNALLVHIQQPGSKMVGTAVDWLHKYGSKLIFNAKPLIILWPFGPVNFVYDISDTEATDSAREIHEDILNPFQPSGFLEYQNWQSLMDNLPRQGVMASTVDLGAVRGGSIQRIPGKYYVYEDNYMLKLLYFIKLRKNVDRLTAFATWIHELGHLFCGHLNGNIKEKRFPIRNELAQREDKE